MSRLILFVFLLAVLVLVLSFSVNNSHSVLLNYYVGSFDVPLALLLVVTLSVGALVGLLAIIRPLLALRMEVAKLRRSVRVSSQEVENLRALPIREP
jgi:putative membrane protein